MLLDIGGWHSKYDIMKNLHITYVDPEKIEQNLDHNTQQVIALLKKFHVPVRIVGGAVRDMLLGKKPRDIDLVADVDPAVLIYIFDSHDIPVDYGGIIHGTVKAVFGHGNQQQKVDVSSLGYRIKRHGHSLDILGTHNWRKDSLMRDITINSMSMDQQGKVYDYQTGLHDLKHQIVRMCEHSRDAMILDPNGIMRYFKAISMFPHAHVIKSDLDFIAKNVHLLADVADDERVQMNLLSILRSPNKKHVQNLMCALHVDKYLPFVEC